MSEDNENNTDLARRRFMGGLAAAAAGTAVAPGIVLVATAEAKPADQAVTSKVRWGMLINTTKCADGCDACVRACNEENGLTQHDDPLRDAQWIRKVEVKNPDTGYSHSFPVMCQHCAEPPCADVCPTGASFKRADGIVLVDKHICIGCRYCMMACPYKARSFVHEPLHDQKSYMPRGMGTVESCTFCVHRVDNNQVPACVEACGEDGHKALVFGDLKDPNSEIAQRLAEYGGTQIRKDLGLNPGVHYKGI